MGDRKFWREFIQLYRSLPILWQMKSDINDNKGLKHEGYLKLMEKYREIDPVADIGKVKKKLNMFQTNYHRELKKVLKRNKPNTPSDLMYKPSIWYYKELDFLSDQNIQIGRTWTIREKIEEICLIDTMQQCPQEKTLENTEYTNKIKIIKTWTIKEKNEVIYLTDTMQQCPQEKTLENTKNIIGTSPSVAMLHEPPKKKRKMQNSRKIQSAKKQLQKSTSVNNILANTWTTELNNVEPDQQLFAQNAISNIIHQARLKTLNHNSVQINPSFMNESCLYFVSPTPIYLLQVPTLVYSSRI